MDTETVNRVITEITNRLGVGYSVFSDAVRQYAQAKATESLIFSVVFFIMALLIIAIFFFALLPDRSIEREVKLFLTCLFIALLLFVVIPGIFTLASYINWSNAPQGMFLREILMAVK
ncbi:hypothetical protein [Lancefieldella parvula]|uniref:hypothetical protein n=1 Tax=Lancefieldella parvula TaxID=1382 RepID=UPI0028E75A3B|nr:hypothetical protein [Lancefieldella parvula]